MSTVADRIFAAAEQAHRESGKIVTISLTDTAKLIRVVLRRKWPDTKFRVRTKRYAGGSSISVGWVLGPEREDVDKVIRSYSGSAAFRSNPGTTGSIPPKKADAPDERAIPVSFWPDFVQGQRYQSEPIW